MKNRVNYYLIGSIAFIFLAIIVVSILNRIPTKSTPADVRARAGNQYALKLTGFVSAVHEVKGTLNVESVQLIDTAYTEQPKDLGEWVVTAPIDFNFASVSPGTPITIQFDSQTFNVAGHTVTAISITPAN